MSISKAKQRRARRAGLLLFAIVTLASLSARAQLDLRARVSETTGLTIDMSGAADGFAAISPSAGLSFLGTRSLQHLGYTFSAFLYFRSFESSTYSNTLDYLGGFAVSRDVRLLLGLSAAQGRQGAISLTRDPSANQLSLLPRADVAFVSVAADEHLEWEISDRWLAGQATLFNAFLPYTSAEAVQGKSFVVDGDLLLRRRWTLDALGARPRARYVTNTATSEIPSAPYLILSAVAEWVHDISESLSSHLNAGFVAGLRSDSAAARVYQPAGLAALHYARDTWQASATYSHDVRSDPLLNQLYIEERFVATGALPLDRKEHLRLSASLGYAFARRLDLQSGALGDGMHLLLSDVGVAWDLWSYVSLSLRYQLNGQLHVPVVGGGTTSDLTQSVLLGVGVVYPGRDTRPRVPPGRPADRVNRDEWEQLFAPSPKPPAPVR